MGEESDQLRRQIEQTRQELGTDVDALTEKVSPKRVVERRVEGTKNAIGGFKERIMGTTSDVTSSAGGTVSGTASSMQDTVSGAASGVRAPRPRSATRPRRPRARRGGRPRASRSPRA